MSRFSFEKFLSHRAGKFRREPFCAVFQKTSGSEKFSDKKGGGASRFSVEFFCITVPKNLIGEPFSVSLNSGIEKLYASEGYVTIFRRKNFVSQYQNISKRNRSVLCFSKFPVAKLFWIRRGGGVSRFSVEFFLCRNAKKFHRLTFKCVINFGFRKILRFRGLCHDFPSKKFCLTVPKHFEEEPFCAVFQ